MALMGRPLDRLHTIAHGRSGDKGNHANVAIIAYTDAGYAWLRQNLTSEAVADYFRQLRPTGIVRYEAANLKALTIYDAANVAGYDAARQDPMLVYVAADQKETGVGR